MSNGCRSQDPVQSRFTLRRFAAVLLLAIAVLAVSSAWLQAQFPENQEITNVAAIEADAAADFQLFDTSDAERPWFLNLPREPKALGPLVLVQSPIAAVPAPSSSPKPNTEFIPLQWRADAFELIPTEWNASVELVEGLQRRQPTSESSAPNVRIRSAKITWQPTVAQSAEPQQRR